MKSYAWSVVGAMTIGARASRNIRSMPCAPAERRAAAGRASPGSVTLTAASVAAAFASSTSSCVAGPGASSESRTPRDVRARGRSRFASVPVARAASAGRPASCSMCSKPRAVTCPMRRLHGGLGDADADRGRAHLEHRQHDAEHHVQALARRASARARPRLTLSSVIGALALPRIPSPSQAPATVTPGVVR